MKRTRNHCGSENVLSDFYPSGCVLALVNSGPNNGRRTTDDGHNSAFTLLELMIAIAIFGGVMLAIYSSWTAILRSSKVGLQAAAEAQRTRMAMRALQEALGSAQLFAGNIHHYSFFSDTSGNFAALSFASRLPASFPGSGLFGDQTLRRVTFSVEPGPESRNQLVLRQSPLLEPLDQSAQPYKIVLAPHVKLFQVEFLDTNTFEWLPEWMYTNQLPRMVKVSVSFGSGQERVRPEDITVQTIALTSVAIPRELQVPMIGRAGGLVPTPGGARVPGGGAVPLPGGDSRRGTGIPEFRGDRQRDFFYRGDTLVPPRRGTERGRR